MDDMTGMDVPSEATNSAAASGDAAHGEPIEARTWGRPASADSARVHKAASREPRTLKVPISHDELRVEYVPVTDETAAHALGPDAFSEKDIDVPLMGEQVTLEKRTRLTEEVVLRKQCVTEQRTYTGKVRKERVWVEGPDGRQIAADDSPARHTTG